MQAPSKEKVLDALTQAATNLREKLGESLNTLQKFNTPLEATTSSIEALQAFSAAEEIHGREENAIPLLKRAIELDPNFAAAYVGLADRYFDIGELGLASESIKKAFELRDRVSEKERASISVMYYIAVTGELEKAIEVFKQWVQTYPRAAGPHHGLAVNYLLFGQYEKALSESLEAIRLNADHVNAYALLMNAYTSLNRFDEAKATYEKAMARNFDEEFLHSYRYALAFLEGDDEEMKRQVAWANGKPVAEDLLLSAHADAEAYAGSLRKALQFSRQAASAARRNDQKETAAQWLLDSALREAEVGDKAGAREELKAARALASSRELQTLEALVLARTGDTIQSQTMVEELRNKFPTNTMLQVYWLPSIGAAIELDRKNPAKAIALLDSTSFYELGQPFPQCQVVGTLYPIYLRGEAYLQAGQGEQAAAEFQKIADHRGIVANFILGVLARLQMGRAKALTGDKESARNEYRYFFTLWKDADSDIPILKAAKAEYAKLH